MLTRLNLSSKPFNNRALPWTITSVVILVSLVALIFIVRATDQANTASNSVQKDIGLLNQQEQTLVNRAEEIKKSLTPQQLENLQAAHELVDRKRFSWSRLFADLESALPANARITRISVRDIDARDEQTLAVLDITIVAKAPATITDMIAEMDRAGIFQAELRSQNLQKGKGESGTEYELYVFYRPRNGTASSENRTLSLAAVDNAATASNR